LNALNLFNLLQTKEIKNMKNTLKHLLIVCILLIASEGLNGQANSQSDTIIEKELVVIKKHDGTEFIGYIIQEDAREVLIELINGRNIYIPAHQIKSIEKVKKGEINTSGDRKETEVFATRYDLTTNALPIEKGESYYTLSLLGPEVHFGVAKNLGLGVITSWIGAPILGTIKYTVNIEENINIGVGGIVGTVSWANPDNIIALPFGVLTFGDKTKNLNFSGGYGIFGERGNYTSTPLASVAGMIKINKTATFVFDSFLVYPNDDDNFGIFTPAIRLHRKNNASSFQFGFSAIRFDNEMIPVPFPNLKWFFKL
jgi:hypothetical protein